MQSALLLLSQCTASAAAATPEWGLTIGDCSSALAQWEWSKQTITHTPLGPATTPTLCLGLPGPVGAGVQPVLQPCSPSDTAQRWAVSHETVSPATSLEYGWVSENGSEKVGSKVWLYNVVTKSGYCAAHQSCSFAYTPATTGSGGVFKNPAGNCVIVAATTPAPPPPLPPPSPSPPPPPPAPSMAYTCAPGSAESKLPFCNVSLGFDARAEDLVNRLNTSEQVSFFFSYPGKWTGDRFTATVRRWTGYQLIATA